MNMTSKFVVVDNIRTHYLEGGAGKPVVLLHSGEFGASAELCFRYNFEVLTEKYRVVAPDWLGFGETDKIYDFVRGRARRLEHMAAVLRTLDIGPAAYIGSSMGGSELVRNIATRSRAFEAKAMILSSSGGFTPDNQARRTILEYDASREGMRKIVETLFVSPAWAATEEFVNERYEASLSPGAWESLAAARFRSPAVAAREFFGQEDTTPYENIDIPTLVVAGEQDPLREPGYADELHKRIPDSEIRVYRDTGHFPHIEQSDRFNMDMIAFLDKRYPS